MIGTVIWCIVVAIMIANAVNKSKNGAKRGGKGTPPLNTASGSPPAPAAGYQEAKRVPPPSSAKNTAQQGNGYRASQSAPSAGGGQKRVMTDADRQRLEEYRRKKAGLKQAPQPDIVERAKANSQRYAKDETLAELERQHRHSERVGSAVAGYVETEREEHRRMHEEPMPRVEEASLLGSVEDLMVKGYSGSLSFERDFIGEAADMLAVFTMSE